MENALTYIGIAVIILALFWWIKWEQYPRRNTQRLAITVWAAYGPYTSATDAEDQFRTIARVVLGLEGIKKHEAWVQGHVDNFHEWEAEGRIERAEKIMRNGLLLTAGGTPFNEA